MVASLTMAWTFPERWLTAMAPDTAPTPPEAATETERMPVAERLFLTLFEFVSSSGVSASEALAFDSASEYSVLASLRVSESPVFPLAMFAISTVSEALPSLAATETLPEDTMLSPEILARVPPLTTVVATVAAPAPMAPAAARLMLKAVRVVVASTFTSLTLVTLVSSISALVLPESTLTETTALPAAYSPADTAKPTP